jgi:hypothetical protein
MTTMFSALQSSQVMIVVAILGIVVGAPARASEPTPRDQDPLVEELLETKCVELDRTLELRIPKSATDVWSYDANAWIGNSRGDVTLLVAIGDQSGSIPLIIGFETQDEFVTLTDGRGTDIRLIPNGKLEPVVAAMNFVVDEPFTITATSNVEVGPKKPPSSNKAILKPVTGCPRPG